MKMEQGQCYVTMLIMILFCKREVNKMKEAYVKPNAIQESALTGVIPAAIAVGPLTAALLGGMAAGVAAGHMLKGDHICPNYRMRSLPVNL